MLPSGQAGQRTNIQYAIAISLLQTIPLSMKYASRAMVVKQGMVVYEGKVGRGQLNAAYSGLGTLCSIFANLLWGSACKSRLPFTDQPVEGDTLSLSHKILVHGTCLAC